MKITKEEKKLFESFGYILRHTTKKDYLSYPRKYISYSKNGCGSVISSNSINEIIEGIKKDRKW